MKIAALYARVSTGRQEREETIESQIAEIKERIRQDGCVLPDNLIFIDDGWSGGLLQRPDLDRMRDAAIDGEFEVLYVYDLGRLSRDFLNQLILLDELGRLNKQVISLHDINPESEEEVFVQRVMGLFHDYERRKIAEQMRRGKLYKARKGKIVHGPAPFGYRYIPKTKDKLGNTTEGYFEIVKEDARYVKQMFDWVGNEKLTIRKVIKRLADKGIRPPKSKRGYWSNSTLSRLFRCEAYIGNEYYNKSVAVEPENPLSHDKYKKIKKSSRKNKPKEDWIAIPIPPVIKADSFYKVQEQLKANSKFSERNKKHDYLLSGLMFCECGERMGCEGGNNPNRYHRGEARLKHYPLETPCKAAGVNTDRVDGVVWNKVIGLLISQDLIQKQAERWLDGKEKRNSVQEDIDNIKILLSRLDEEEKRQAKAYGQELITFQSFKELMDDIKQRRESLNKQLLELVAKQQRQQVIPNLSVDQVVQAVPVAVGKFEFEDKRKVLLSMIKEIIVNQARTHVKIRGYIPLYLRKEENQKYELRSISRNRRTGQCGEVDVV
jgi:site-specific DNA recombinase